MNIALRKSEKESLKNTRGCLTLTKQKWSKQIDSPHTAEHTSQLALSQVLKHYHKPKINKQSKATTWTKKRDSKNSQPKHKSAMPFAKTWSLAAGSRRPRSRRGLGRFQRFQMIWWKRIWRCRDRALSLDCVMTMIIRRLSSQVRLIRKSNLKIWGNCEYVLSILSLKINKIFSHSNATFF